MKNKKTYLEDLKRIRGSTVAIVYIFEGEDAPGFTHYHIWQSDIISGWMNAVQELHCRPFLLDVRTFVEKAICGTLPHIDYVLNLNCGSCELSPMGLVPSTCAFLKIPCIPCNTVSIITGEHKRISNFIAKALGLQVPCDLDRFEENGIYRPLNFGSSLGVRRGTSGIQEIDGLYQEFITGFDITTPIVYDPLSDTFEFFPTILYIPDSEDLSWFFGEDEKLKKTGYIRKIIHQMTPELKEKYLALMEPFSIKTFCRIDARLHCTCKEATDALFSQPLGLEHLFFVEINAMPTVGGDNSFCHAFRSITEEDPIHACVQLQEEQLGTVSPNGFLLACSMLAYFRARC